MTHNQPTMQAFDRALHEARTAARQHEVPVGAAILDANGKILTTAHNLTESQNDPTAHAEILAMRAAAAILKSPRLPTCDLVVTLEPCPMCAHAISLFRIRRLIFGAYDPKGGGVTHGPRIFDHSTCHHRPENTGGVREQECATLLQDFFRQKRP